MIELARRTTIRFSLPEDTFFLSLLALPPAANVVESIFFTEHRLPNRPSTSRVGAYQSGKILSDCAGGAAPFWIAERADATGHHRYYGRSAYP
jgi:hypothetical protein